jgi:hypothetical protein
VTSIECPAKKTTHRVKEISSLCRRSRPAVAAGDDMLALDGGCLFVTGLEKHVAHDVFTLASGR